MASFLELYNDVEYKIKQAALRLNESARDIERLQEENSQLKEMLKEKESQVVELQEKYELLTITKTILKKEDKIETKKKINDLVREIDNCILLLNK